MTWQDEARARMDDMWVLYQGKDEKKNQERARRKAQAIEWTIGELSKGWLVSGTRSDPPVAVWQSSDFKVVREAVLIANRRRCASCGEEADEVHHIRPRHLGGTDHPRNLMPLCEACHDEIHRKLDEYVEDAIVRATAETDGTAEGSE